MSPLVLLKRAASEELDDGHDDTSTSRDKSMPMAPVILCVCWDQVQLFEGDVLFGVEALNRNLLICDRGFCAMFSQNAQAQSVEVIQLVPKEKISEHIVEEIVVLVPQVMEETKEGRVQNRTVKQIRDVLTPHTREENVEETKPIPQE